MLAADTECSAQSIVGRERFRQTIMLLAWYEEELKEDFKLLPALIADDPHITGEMRGNVFRTLEKLTDGHYKYKIGRNTSGTTSHYKCLVQNGETGDIKLCVNVYNGFDYGIERYLKSTNDNGKIFDPKAIFRYLTRAWYRAQRKSYPAHHTEINHLGFQRLMECLEKCLLSAPESTERVLTEF